MSVSVRLTKTGKKNAPSFRIVATQTRNKRDGQVLENLGYYNPSQGIGSERNDRSNPSHQPPQLSLNKDRLQYWKSVGAIFSKAVDKLISGEYQYVKYSPSVKKEVTEKGT